MNLQFLNLFVLFVFRLVINSVCAESFSENVVTRGRSGSIEARISCASP